MTRFVVFFFSPCSPFKCSGFFWWAYRFSFSLLLVFFFFLLSVLLSPGIFEFVQSSGPHRSQVPFYFIIIIFFFIQHYGPHDEKSFSAIFESLLEKAIFCFLRSISVTTVYSRMLALKSSSFSLNRLSLGVIYIKGKVTATQTKASALFLKNNSNNLISSSLFKCN